MRSCGRIIHSIIKALRVVVSVIAGTLDCLAIPGFWCTQNPELTRFVAVEMLNIMVPATGLSCNAAMVLSTIRDVLWGFLGRRVGLMCTSEPP